MYIIICCYQFVHKLFCHVLLPQSSLFLFYNRGCDCVAGPHMPFTGRAVGRRILPVDPVKQIIVFLLNFYVK